MKFKVGDRVRTVTDYPEIYLRRVLAGSIGTVEGFEDDLLKVKFDGLKNIEDMFEERFELYTPQEEPKMNTQLKKNWSIAVTKENAEVYKNVLIALGYELTDDITSQEFTAGRRMDIRYNTHQGFWFSQLGAYDHHFNSLESFLIWHYTPEITEEQKKMAELEETIKQASIQLQQLKAMAK